MVVVPVRANVLSLDRTGAYTANACPAVVAMGLRRVMTMPLPWLAIHCLVGGRQDLLCLNGVVPAQAKGVYVALKWR